MIPRAGDFLALARRGLFVDLSSYADRFGWRRRLLAPALRLGTLDGRLFGVPRSSETLLLLTGEGVHRPPATLAELELVAGDALSNGLLPFGAGCADYPQTCELLWTLVVNHYAGPAAVRAALRGELNWTAEVFLRAIGMLCTWFERGWFGHDYFTDTMAQGLAHLTSGRAVMAPAMTGMLPERAAGLTATPFPALRPGLPSPVYVFGTASVLGLNAASLVPDESAAVLDAVLTSDVRRVFAARLPGDWNIPLVDPDARGLRNAAPSIFAEPAIGLTWAVRQRRCGYATWSFLPPRAEALVVEHVRPLVEGRLTAQDHLAQLQHVVALEQAPGLD